MTVNNSNILFMPLHNDDGDFNNDNNSNILFYASYRKSPERSQTPTGERIHHIHTRVHICTHTHARTHMHTHPRACGHNCTQLF